MYTQTHAHLPTNIDITGFMLMWMDATYKKKSTTTNKNPFPLILAMILYFTYENSPSYEWYIFRR